MKLQGAIIAFALCASARAEVCFTPGNMADWSTQSFAGYTDYEVVTSDGHSALRARARNAASARYHTIDIDLDETPYLVWSWQADKLPQSQHGERSKNGDDYALRVYVVHEGWLGRLSARALNYVWTRSEPAGEQWPNAFTSRARMIAANSGSSRLGEWVTHSRDLRRDWQAAFDDQVESLDGVALMTDADNTGSEASGYYGTIRFCASPDCDGAPPAQAGRPTPAGCTWTPVTSTPHAIGPSGVP